MNTAVPHAATDAPKNHITREKPTLPEDLRMALGVANILVNQIQHYLLDPAKDSCRNQPSSNHTIYYQEGRAHQPCHDGLRHELN